MEYESFLEKKQWSDPKTGLKPNYIHDQLFPFQRDIVRWALRRGRAAIFADCGLGKTAMQVEWAAHIPGPVLILAPLAVSAQTAREANVLLNYHVQVCESQDDVIEKAINITNYEKLHKFDTDFFTGIVLDESSIIKHHTSKTRDQLLSAFSETPYRLACTATPSPNDYMELGNHSEFLGVMSRSEMLSMFFIHDGGDTSKWRLKGHAEDEFWKWLCQWAVMVRKPSDLGHDDDGFILPPINIHQHTIKSGITAPGMLFSVPAKSLLERRKARKLSLDDRCLLAADIVNSDNESWVVWCDLNDESALLSKLINGSVEVKGSDDNKHKENAMLGFSDGKYRVMVSKPSIAGFGLNWQHCHNMAFVGLSDSFESYYQATRRCWRFGQKYPVDVHVITSDLEGAVVQNIQRKERDALAMADNMVAHMGDIQKLEIRGTKRQKTVYNPTVNISLPSFMEGQI